jgi:hypothetical protein
MDDGARSSAEQEYIQSGMGEISCRQAKTGEATCQKHFHASISIYFR